MPITFYIAFWDSNFQVFIDSQCLLKFCFVAVESKLLQKLVPHPCTVSLLSFWRFRINFNLYLIGPVFEGLGLVSKRVWPNHRAQNNVSCVNPTFNMLLLFETVTQREALIYSTVANFCNVNSIYLSSCGRV